jgi:hypothetical protein
MTTENEAAPYTISQKDAEMLMGVIVPTMPHDIRVTILKKLGPKSRAEMIELFAQFIGMCARIEENSREFLQLFAITELNVHFREAEKLQFPSMFGALNGIQNAVEPTPGMCSTCAYRLGSVANQCPITSQDADDAADGMFKFHCHHDLDDKGEPTRLCAGWAKLQVLRAQQA